MPRISVSEPSQRTRRVRRRHLHWAATLLLATSSALAEPDDATKNAARELAEQAAAAMDGEDFARAVDLYERAYSLVAAPTLSVRHARALTKAGRWVEALEAYVRTTRSRLDDDSPAPFREAVQQAYDELAELRPRVPKLTVVVQSAAGKLPDVSVTLDGKPYANALLGVASPVDPGHHEVAVAAADGRVVRKDFAVEEGQSTSVVLDVPETSDDEPTAATAAPAPKPEARVPERPRPASKPPASSQRTWALVSLGAGAAGLGLGIVTGVMATSQHSTAEENCPGGQCVEGSAGADAVESFRTLRTVSTIGYALGVIGVGAGVTLWLTAPDPERGARVGAFVGADRAGVLGRF